MISKMTAYDIAVAFEAIEHAEKLLAEVEKEIERERGRGGEPIRDHFGRQVQGLRLEVPSGQNSHRIFNVSWLLAKPIVEAHIADCKARLTALQVKATVEARPTPSSGGAE